MTRYSGFPDRLRAIPKPIAPRPMKPIDVIELPGDVMMVSTAESNELQDSFLSFFNGERSCDVDKLIVFDVFGNAEH